MCVNKDIILIKEMHSLLIHSSLAKLVLRDFHNNFLYKIDVHICRSYEIVCIQKQYIRKSTKSCNIVLYPESTAKQDKIYRHMRTCFVHSEKKDNQDREKPRTHVHKSPNHFLLR